MIGSCGHEIDKLTMGGAGFCETCSLYRYPDPFDHRNSLQAAAAALSEPEPPAHDDGIASLREAIPTTFKLKHSVDCRDPDCDRGCVLRHHAGIPLSCYNATSLPSEGRKEIPMVSGLLDYFPAALAAVAALSKKGNDQHNPGEPMHHARGKSMDHADCIVRHLMDRGTVDTDGVRHAAKVAWRALALLQEELELCEGAAFPRGAKR